METENKYSMIGDIILNILIKSISKLIFTIIHDDMVSTKQKKKIKELLKMKKNCKETKMIVHMSSLL